MMTVPETERIFCRALRCRGTDQNRPDGVEHHALNLLVLDRALLFQDLQHVPGNRFTLAIRVGCENQPGGALERFGDIVESACRLRVDLPDHLEVGLRIDRSLLRREIADMAK